MEGEVFFPGFGGDDGVGYAVDDVARVAATRKKRPETLGRLDDFKLSVFDGRNEPFGKDGAHGLDGFQFVCEFPHLR